jgi:hypothetical protein
VHLFILCPFTKLIWQKIKNIKKFTQVWRGIDLNECLSNWTADKNASPNLVVYIYWYIWLEINATTFEGKEPPFTAVVINTLGNYQRSMVKKNNPPS